MSKTTFNDLLDAGAHFGHLTRKWDPNMAPYIFMERNGIHIIDLHKTIAKLDEAANALGQIAKSGRKILFVATKKQAKDIVAERIKAINMPYVTERWSGGMLTNFPTIRKAVKKMASIDKMTSDGTFNHLSKRERLQIVRQRAKLEKNLGSIADLTRLPAALFVVDIQKERIAVLEAIKLNIPVFAMVDTNSNPNMVDFAIPANDDAAKSIDLIVSILAKSIQDGLVERKSEREKEASSKENKDQQKQAAKEAKPDGSQEKAETRKTSARKTSVKTKDTKEKKPEIVSKEMKKEEKAETKTEALPNSRQEKAEK